MNGQTILTILVSMLLSSALGIQLIIPVRTTMPGTAAIDLYTQKEDPYSGKGPNQPSGRFMPQEEVILYAYVTNNSNAVPNNIVAFEIHGPPNSIDNITIIRTALTNASGVATINFRIPWISENPEIAIGMWSAYASVQIAEEKTEDTLAFMVGLIVDDDGPADFRTIQEAINNATDGDTIFVRAGTYYEHIFVNKSLALIGENKYNTIIDGNGTDVVVRCYIHFVISGFTVTNGNTGLYWANNAEIKDNIFSHNLIGIQIGYNNIVIRNVFCNNNLGGLLVFEGNGNTIYHNNFINNTNWQASIVFPNSAYDTWDDGYPSGGNYWSDYNGTDLYSGPYQNETGSDGIGDTSYVLDWDMHDRYPLMYPYSFVPSPDVNNDGIVDIFDVVICALAYGSRPGHLNWNPIADLKNDRLIDIFDLVIIGINYGKRW